MTTENAHRRWWAGLTPDERDELRRLDGQALTARTTELIEDVDGRPLGFELGEPESGLFHLPSYLLDLDDDEGER